MQELLVPDTATSSRSRLLSRWTLARGQQNLARAFSSRGFRVLVFSGTSQEISTEVTAGTCTETRRREGNQQRRRGANGPECGCSRRDVLRRHSEPPRHRRRNTSAKGHGGGRGNENHRQVPPSRDTGATATGSTAAESDAGPGIPAVCYRADWGAMTASQKKHWRRTQKKRKQAH